MTLEKKILSLLMLGLKPETFQSQVQYSTAELSPLLLFQETFHLKGECEVGWGGGGGGVYEPTI